jgi:biopolymer transport protein ExbB/TolQ
MNRPLVHGTLLMLMLLLAGCTAYTKAGERTRATERQTVEEKRTLEADKAKNVRLQDQSTQLERENERVAKRISATQDELRRQDVALKSALSAKKVTQSRYNELKTELDSIQAEAQRLDLQHKGDSIGKPDAAAQGAKEKRLQQLEDRKRNLETTLQQLGKS